MKKLIIFTAAMLALSGCASQGGAPSDPENTTVTTKNTATTSIVVLPGDEPSSSQSEQQRETAEITADVLSFEENSISVSYEGTEYTINLSECEYNSDIEGYAIPNITDRIINNPFGIKTKVKLSCDPELTKAYYCDAVTPNGSMGVPDTGRPDKEYIIDSYTLMGKGSNSLYDFTYFEKSEKGEYQADGRIDLSGSDIFMTPRFGEGSSISDMYFKFDEDNCFISLYGITLENGKEEKRDETGKVISVSRSYSAEPIGKYIYYGRVTETDETAGKVTIELNGGPICTLAPSVTIDCYSLSVGDTVRVSFTEQEDYLDQPQQTDFDFAVIEKADGISGEVLVFNNGNVYASDGEYKLTLIPEVFVDADTSEEITDTAGYKKVYVAFEDMLDVTVDPSDRHKLIYDVKTVQLGR